ncbi:MAG: hypothetical protein Tsb0026_15410 [Sulfuricaulis sp.]
MYRLAQALRNTPLRWKVVTIMLGLAAISLAIASAGLMWREYQEFEHKMEQRLTLLADVIGLNSTAALAFNDPAAAAEILAALDSDEHVMAGALYDARERLFVRYLRSDIERQLPELAPSAGRTLFADDTAELVRTIKLKGQPVGKVYLLADTTEWRDALWGYAGIVAILFIVVLTVGLFVSIWLQRLITEPIFNLVQLMRRVGQEGNYALRATKLGDDELGTLVDGFNVMLDEIVKNRAELRQLNEELERRVLNRTEQLEMANKELEAFSYSVSHDLRAPLRAIDGFSRILLEDHAAALNTEGRDNLERVLKATQRMGSLIDDLLRLARVTRTEPSRSEVNLSVIAQEISKSLREQDPERRVRFELMPGLTTQGDPRLLRIALENLLGNAWKFTGKQPESQIELGIKHENGAPVYFVRDNGAGFDMTYANKLFSPFQRLHTADEFPGTGIGLATVQRIMRKHGGRIWAESAVGQGAAFYFTLT